jgi:hypothetical protein
MIRPLYLSDLLFVRSCRDLPLNLDHGAAASTRSLWGMVTSFLPLDQRGALTFVYHDQGQVMGLIQARQRLGSNNWDVTRLAAVEKNPDSRTDSETIYARLLEQLAVAAGEHGGQRLYAKAPAEAPGFAAFGQAGFAVYGQEEVFVRAGQAPVAPLPADDPPLRPQQPRDAWGILRLYHTVAPKMVQLAEARTAADWECRWRPGERCYVLEQKGDIIGYVHASYLEHRLELLLHPQAYPLAGALVRGGLAGLAFPHESDPRRLARLMERPLRDPVYCCLPAYQGGLSEALETNGFRFLACQAQLVREITAAIKERVPVLQPVLERGLEPVAARTKAQAVKHKPC